MMNHTTAGPHEDCGLYSCQAIRTRNRQGAEADEYGKDAMQCP
jgi:hypothetical protein